MRQTLIVKNVKHIPVIIRGKEITWPNTVRYLGLTLNAEKVITFKKMTELVRRRIMTFLLYKSFHLLLRGSQCRNPQWRGTQYRTCEMCMCVKCIILMFSITLITVSIQEGEL